MTQIIDLDIDRNQLPEGFHQWIVVKRGDPQPDLPEDAVVYKWHNRMNDYYVVVKNER